MPVYNTLPEEIQEVDVVIAGGGTTGCIIAARLAAADPGLSILVIESGRDNHEATTVVNPILWRGNYLHSNPRVFFHKSVKESQLGDRESLVQVGNTLGGGSSINLMMYVRAQKSDFDSWGMEGWKGDDMLQYLRKVETYHETSKGDSHGDNGPIHVSRGNYSSTESKADFINAMKELGYPEVEDLQDLESLGVEAIRKYVSPDGKRSDTAHAYLHPLLQDDKHPSLHVLVETEVVRVLFDDDRRASGIEFRPNPIFQPDHTKEAPRAIKARRLVVLTCGTLGTPPLLERSGVGNATVLEKAGVPLVANVPGVGHDYQDHNVSIYVYKADLAQGTTTDDIHGGFSDIPGLLSSKDPILGWNGIDAASKIRPTPMEVERLGDEFRESWNKDFEALTTKPLVSFIFHAGLLGDRTNIPRGQYFAIAAVTMYPYSRGHMHITGRNLDDRLDFATGYLTDESGFDLKTQIWAYKKQREVARRMRINQGEIPHRHPQFAPGHAAANGSDAGDEGGPSPPIADIVYSPEDNQVLGEWIRKNMTTCWHGLGTCKMAPQESLGVVNKDLDVYGVRGLKVADLSVAPQNVGANTMNTALVIGEKAADIFIEELGLGQ
ncbi:alcohol oxidase-like protein [Thozetella sp. PMI_491]|nr:alcohol oxidase-like protein [Thozetella sp. PMI_491]